MANALLNTEAGQALPVDAIKRGGGKPFTDRYFHSYLHSDGRGKNCRLTAASSAMPQSD